MAHVTHKDLAGKIGHGGKIGRDRRVYLAKWKDSTDAKEREKSFPTKHEAELFVATKNLESGTRRLKPAAKRILRERFATVAAHYLASLAVTDHERGALRTATIKAHKGRIENHANAVLGDKFVDLITDEDLRLLRTHLMDSSLARKTQREVLRITRAVLTFAHENRLIESVPGATIKIARTSAERAADRDHHDTVAFTPGEVYTLLRTADALAADPSKRRSTAWAKHRGMIYLLVHSGLRISEVRGLRRSEVDLVGGFISVSQSADVFGKINPTKTLRSRRKVPIVREAIEPLRVALATHNHDLAFASTEGTPVWDRNLRERVLAPLIAKANAIAAPTDKADSRLVPVRALGFHSFRHAYASRLISRGATLKQLQVYLGHHDPAFTLKIYGHLIEEDTSGLMERMAV